MSFQDIADEIMKRLQEPPEVAYQYNALLNEVMANYTLVYPDQAKQKTTFENVTQRLTVLNMIVLENNVFRLYQNRKTDRTPPKRQHASLMQRLWGSSAYSSYGVGHRVADDDDDEDEDDDESEDIMSHAVLTRKYLFQTSGETFEFTLLQTPQSESTNYDRLFNPIVAAQSIPKKKAINIPKTCIHIKETDYTKYDKCVPDRLYYWTDPEEEDVVVFFVDGATATLYYAVFTDSSVHPLDIYHLASIYTMTQESMHMPDIKYAGVLFLVPPGCKLSKPQTMTWQRDDIQQPRYKKQLVRVLRVFVSSQWLAILLPLQTASPANKRQTHEAELSPPTRVLPGGRQLQRGSGTHQRFI